jgi:hypothetical protein
VPVLPKQEAAIAPAADASSSVLFKADDISQFFNDYQENPETFSLHVKGADGPIECSPLGNGTSNVVLKVGDAAYRVCYVPPMPEGEVDSESPERTVRLHHELASMYATYGIACARRIDEEKQKRVPSEVEQAQSEPSMLQTELEEQHKKYSLQQKIHEQWTIQRTIFTFTNKSDGSTVELTTDAVIMPLLEGGYLLSEEDKIAAVVQICESTGRLVQDLGFEGNLMSATEGDVTVAIAADINATCISIDPDAPSRPDSPLGNALKYIHPMIEYRESFSFYPGLYMLLFSFIVEGLSVREALEKRWYDFEPESEDDDGYKTITENYDLELPDLDIMAELIETYPDSKLMHKLWVAVKYQERQYQSESGNITPADYLEMQQDLVKTTPPAQTQAGSRARLGQQHQPQDKRKHGGGAGPSFKEQRLAGPGT